MYQKKTEDLIDDLVEKYIKEGFSRLDLVAYLMNELGYKTSYAYELIRMANKKIEDVMKETISDKFTMSLTLLQQQYHRAVKNKNDRLALEIVREINKISGLYKENVQLNGDIRIRTNWGDEDDDI